MDVSKEDYHKTPEKFGKLLNEVPSRKFKEKMDSNTQALGEMQQTPRRSCRKSIKPLQDYVQIVSQTMRSTKKSIFSEEDSQDKDYELADQEKPKRTPAKAGRRSRKTRRDSKTKVSELHESKDKEHNTTEDEQIKLNHTRKENNLEKILEDVELEGREDENKENIQVIGKKRENEDELKEYSNENNNEGDKQFQVAKAELQKSLTIETQNGCTSSEKKDTRLSIQKGRINDSVHTEEQEEYMSIKKDIINQEEEKHLFTKENSNNEIGHIEEQNEAKSNEEQGDVEMHGINEIIIEQEQYSIKGRVQKENCRQTFPEGANKDITFQENCNQTYTEDASKDAAAIVKTAEVIEINTISMQMDQEMVAEEETTHADVLVDVIKENEIHDELLKPENENISKSHDGISFAKENSNNEIGHIEEQNEAKSNEEQGDFEMHAINEVIIEQEQYSIKGRLQTENCYQTYTEDASKDAAAIVKTAEVIEINTINMQMSQHVVAEEADVLVDVVKENEIHDELLKPENENISKSHDGISLQIPTEKQEGFGSYLKTKDFDMEDLGLNPLEDDTAQLPQKPYQSLNPAEVNNKPKYEQGNEEFGTEAVLDKVFGEDDEMPSLIYCDDDEDGDYDDYDIEFKKIDSTVIIIEDEIVEDIKSTTFTRDDEVQTFELSDDESEDLTKTPVKSKPVMIRPTCSEKQTQTPSTTRKVRKICRFPTPHSNKLNLFANNMKNYEQRPDQEDSLDKFIDSPVTITTSEPKEALLRGIRKRSLSLCIDGMENDYNPPPKDNLVRPPKIVSFRTPTLGNPQKKKEIMKSDVEAFKTFKNEHVTKRRKRSMSLDEIMNRIPKLRGTGGQVTPKKTEFSALSRTKLPNFAAIHERNFQKMESLVDHVVRKKERSKNLMNSTTKHLSAQKGSTLNKEKAESTTQCKKPKALKKIDLREVEKFKLTSSTLTLNPNDTRSKPKQPLPGIYDVRTALGKPFAREKVMQTEVATSSNTNTNVSNINTISITEKKVLNANQTKLGGTLSTSAVPLKPPFNLSTSVGASVSNDKSNSLQANSTFIKQPKQPDKSSLRLQRHIDLFKSRKPSKDVKNDVIIKGVRSNRRFELQMQHRKNLEK